jgi:hypothetical protein
MLLEVPEQRMSRTGVCQKDSFIFTFVQRKQSCNSYRITCGASDREGSNTLINASKQS